MNEKNKYTEEEKDTIYKVEEYYCRKYIIDHLDDIENNDYLIYLSEGTSIFSPDHKSLAYITSYGDIAIGPASEVNSLKDVEYAQKAKMADQ